MLRHDVQRGNKMDRTAMLYAGLAVLTALWYYDCLLLAFEACAGFTMLTGRVC